MRRTHGICDKRNESLSKTMENFRIKSFGERRETIFDKIIAFLRFRKVIRKIPRGAIVLDVGCGYHGELLRRLGSIVGKGYGVDISVSGEGGLGNIHLIRHDLSMPLPFKNDFFDRVISLANLEHLENADTLFEEMYRVLKPGGILLLTTPTIYSKPVLEFLAYRLHMISEEEICDHKHYFLKKELTDLCRKYGFRNWRHSYFQFGMNSFLRAKK